MNSAQVIMICSSCVLACILDELFEFGLIFFEKFSPCQDLNPGLPEYQADVLPIELSRLGLSYLCFIQVICVLFKVTCILDLF